MDTARARRSGVALILVVVSHVGAVFWFQMTVRIKRAAPEQSQWHGELFFFAVARDNKKTRSPATAASRFGGSTSDPSPAEVVDVQRLQNDAVSIAAHERSIDWSAQVATAANSIVASQNAEQALRSLDSKPITIPKPEVWEKGLFDRGPAHKVGSIDTLGDGLFRTWVTPYCYVLSGMTALGRRDKSICQRSAAEEGGSDLFEALKPKYLKSLPPTNPSEGSVPP